MNSIDNKQKKKKKRHGGLCTSLIALCMTGMAPIIMGFMLFIICAGTVISVYFFDAKEEKQEVIDLSLCPCGDCSQGYEYIGNETTGGNTGGSTSGTDATVAAHGKKVTDPLLNPYDLPLYDGLTMDATKLGCDSWTVEIANNSDPVVQQAAVKNVHSYMYHLQTIGGSPYADASNQTQIRIVDGRLCIAVGRGVYRKPGTEENGDNSDVMLGRYVDVVQKDGTVIACVIGDVKDTHHTIDAADMVHSDGSIVEMQTNDKRYEDYKLAKAFFKASGHPGSGSFSFVPGLNSVIDKIIVYDVKHYTPSQGYKPWFTESLSKVSSAGSTVTDNIIQNGIDAAQNAANNIQNGVNNTQGNTGGTGSTLDTTGTTGINGMTGGTSGKLNLPSDINTLNTQDSDLVGKDNREKIWNYFKSKGFNEYAIAGLMGNMSQESGFDPSRCQGDKASASMKGMPGGYGLIQWTADRKGPLLDYLTDRGLAKDSLAGQLDYLVIEHMTKGVWSNLLNSDLLTKSGFETYAGYNFDSIERAVYEYLYLSERPGWSDKYTTLEKAKDDSNFKTRKTAAEDAYSKFSGKEVPGNNNNNSTGGATFPIGQMSGNKTEVKTNVKLNYSAANVDVANWDGKVPKEYVITSCDPITINQHILPDKNSNPHSGNINAFIVHYWGRQHQQDKEVSGDNLYSGWAPAGVKTSATFSMGTAGDIWQYVPLNRAPNASNTNNGTLAIEVADRLAGGQYTEAEYKALVHLTAWICYTYNLDTDFGWKANPKTNNMYWDYSPLRRHYDTLKSGAFRGKACPAYWVPGDGGSETPQYETAGGNLRWIAFKEDVTNFLIEYKDHQNFAPTNVNELAGYQESLSLIDKSKTPNWANGSVIYGQSDGNGNISSNLADYRGKGCGCKIPCPDCTCHDAQAEEIKNISQIGGTTSGEGSETGSGSSSGTISDSDGVAIQGGEHLGTGGEGIYYKIENNILTFTGDSWASTTFLKNARTVIQYYIASGHGYINGNSDITGLVGERDVPVLGKCRMDCSGYVRQVLRQCGYSISNIRSSSNLNSMLGFEKIAYKDMEPGDIVSYDGHVAIFCGWKPGKEGAKDYLAYNWGGSSDTTAYGAYTEPRDYPGSSNRFLSAYRPVPPS